MAQPPPAPSVPQAWYPAVPPRSTTPQLLAVVLVLVVIAFSVIPFFIGSAFGTFFPGFFATFVCIPFLFIIIVILIAISSSSRRRTIPPPPPIQQPMVPAGQQGPIALNCPNCGGPPTNVDRFGIATCTYCGTRFLVR